MVGDGGIGPENVRNAFSVYQTNRYYSSEVYIQSKPALWYTYT